MKRRKLFSSLWCLVLFFTASAGCAVRQKNVTNLPAGVTLAQVQHWDSAVANLDKIAQANSAARKAIMGLSQQGVISEGPYYGKILTSLGKIDEFQLDAVQFLKAQPKNWSLSTQARVQNDLQLIQAEMQNVLRQQLVGIKNADKQKQFGALITEIGDLTAIILTSIG
jgi:hypothetical protein